MIFWEAHFKFTLTTYPRQYVSYLMYRLEGGGFVWLGFFFLFGEKNLETRFQIFFKKLESVCLSTGKIKKRIFKNLFIQHH